MSHGPRVWAPQGIHSRDAHEHAACLRASARSRGCAFPFCADPPHGHGFAAPPSKWLAPAAVPGAWPAAANLGGAIVPPDFAGGLASPADDDTANLLSCWIMKKRCPSALALRALSRPRHVQAKALPSSC
jgi:hypothetical protein